MNIARLCSPSSTLLKSYLNISCLYHEKFNDICGLQWLIIWPSIHLLKVRGPDWIAWIPRATKVQHLSLSYQNNDCIKYSKLNYIHLKTKKEKYVFYNFIYTFFYIMLKYTDKIINHICCTEKVIYRQLTSEF